MRNGEFLQRLGGTILAAGILFGVVAFSPAIFGNQTFSGLWLLSMMSGLGLALMLYGFFQTARSRSKLVAESRSNNERG
jgi:hypothetical protein